MKNINRVWDKKQNKFLEEFSIMQTKTELVDGGIEITVFERNKKRELQKINSTYLTIERCMGLRDKNKTPIFENDRLRKVLRKYFCDVNDIYKTKKEVLELLREDEDYSLEEVKEGDIVSFEYNDNGSETWIEVEYLGEEDIACLGNFPCLWMKNEQFGYEGEHLQNSEDWLIVGNIHQHEHLLNKRV